MPWPDPAEAPRRLANRWLAKQDWARAKLAPFHGRSFSIAAGPLRAHWTIVEDGTLDAAPEAMKETEADLQLTVPPLDVPALLADPAHWSSVVRESGDPQLAAVLKELAQAGPWLVEQEFAEALGPIAGQRVADAGRELLRFPAYAATRLADSAASYARDEADLLARADAMREFSSTLTRVAAEVEALESRLEKLAARMQNPR